MPLLIDALIGCAGAAAQLRAVVAALHLELLQRIRRRPHRIGRAIQEVLHVGVVVHAVQNEVVLRDAAAIRGEIAAARHLAEALVRRRNARRQLRNEHIIASVQRRVVDGLRLEDLAGGSVFGLQRGRRRHRHHLLAAPGFNATFTPSRWLTSTRRFGRTSEAKPFALTFRV